jgi:2,3-bisphosphoglycerate-independent phosphoglycerate mutase
MSDLKYAVVILDGAAGEPLEAYGNKTTFELADTPNLDALAASGCVGLAVNVPPSLEPSSNVACTSILGYDPLDYQIGRGALELAALGIEMAEDQIALRVNLCHVSDSGLMVSYSTDNLSSEDGHALGEELKQALDDDCCQLYAGTGFRLYLVVRGRSGLMQTEMFAAHDITDMPLTDHPPRGPEADFLKSYVDQARLVLAQSEVNQRRQSEGKMTANEVMIFWPGQRPSGMCSFRDTYGISAGLNSGVDLLVGIANLAGINVYNIPGVSDGPDNDYAAQGEGALKMLDEQDIIFIHVEAPDAEGHDGNAEGKRLAVEAIDSQIISRLRTWDRDELRILALPDHPTPVALKRHTREPVPFCLYGPGIAHNGAQRLTEKEAAATGLVVNPGWQMLRRMIRQKGDGSFLS